MFSAVTSDKMMEFASTIEDVVYMKDVSYMDAVLMYCEDNEVEFEVAASLISDNLKSKIQFEAESLNFLPKSNTTKLPL
jgi:hypothetical protein